MSVAEKREIMISKIKHLTDEEVDKYFSTIVSGIDFDDKNKIDLHKYGPGIFKKYDELMKKLA
jgi:hypothetical protein